MDDGAGKASGARNPNYNNEGASMYYIIQILAAILLGTSIAAALGRRNTVLTIASLAAAGCGVVVLVNGNWIPLVIGTAIFMAAQFMQRDTYVPARG